MAVIGSATLNVVPKFPGFKSTVQAELGKIDATSAGTKFGNSFGQGASGGLAKSGAIVGTFAAVTNKALESISGNVGNAVARFDTLNSYPTVMQTLGYSAESADSSITKMSDHLDGLPTALNDMASTVQGIVAITGDLDEATQVGLAVNDMLLASGSNTQLTNAALEQFRQMLAKGKPELQDWKSLTAAMPGQMNQLAQALLGPTANANDLYTALGGGGAEATISMDQLLSKIVELDTVGGDGITSFSEQAKTATGGVATSVANMSTAFSRGMANTLDAIGKENIAEVFNDAKGAVDSVFSVMNSGVSAAMPLIKSLYGGLKSIAPELVAIGAGSAVFSKGVSFAGQFKDAIAAARKETTALGAAQKILGSSFSPVTLGLTLAATAATAVASAYMEYKQNEENAEKATKGFAEAVADTGALTEYQGVLSNVGSTSGDVATNINDLNASFASHVDKMNQTTADAEEQLGTLNTVQSILSQYAGVSDLSADAQGRLQWAIQQVNDQFGLSITAADVAAGSYTDQNGNVVNLTDSINDLIAAKKHEIEMDALSSNYSEALKAQQEAADAYANAVNNQSQRVEELAQAQMLQGVPANQAYELAQKQANEEIEGFKQASDQAAEGVRDIESEMGDLTKSTGDAADAFDDWGIKMDELTSGRFPALLNSKGGIAGLKEDLRTLGADTSRLNALTEPELEKLATSWDGTASSIVGVLGELNVDMNESAENLASNTKGIQDTLMGMGDNVSEALANVDIEAFSTKLAEAGVSTEQLNAIGSENLASLAASCNGNINAMVFFIQNYNNTPIIDKNGNVTVEKTSLIDAQGNVYTWNGTALLDKDGNAVVNDVDLVDAQGNKVTWNGTGLKSYSSSARVNSNAAEASRDNTNFNNNPPENQSATVTITQVFKQIGQAVSGFFGSATGGVIRHASGGIIRKHADGFIATGPTMIGPQDMIGEAGAEAYVNAGGHDYIVPLTNRQYSQPFIDLLAEGVNEQANNDELVSAMMYMLKTLHNDMLMLMKCIPQLNDQDIDRRIWKGMDRRVRT